MANPKEGQVALTTEQQNSLAAERNGEMEIDLVELFYRLLGAWKLIAIFALAGLLIAFAITWFLITPQYKATSTIYVLSRKDSAINMSDLNIGTALTQDYIKVFDMWEVHEEVISNLDLPYTYSQMKKMLKVSNTSGTRMLDITVTSPNPKEAALIANEYARVSSNFIAETMSTDKPNIVSVALEPTNPVSPSKARNALIGFLAGAVIAAGIVVVQMLLDDKIKTAEDIRKYTGLVNLAIVPVEKETLVTADAKKRSGTRKQKTEDGRI